MPLVVVANSMYASGANASRPITGDSHPALVVASRVATLITRLIVAIVATVSTSTSTAP